MYFSLLKEYIERKKLSKNDNFLDKLQYLIHGLITESKIPFKEDCILTT